MGHGCNLNSNASNIVVCIYQPLCTGKRWHKINFWEEFNSFEFSFPSPTEKPSLPYYLPIAGGRIIEFIPFPKLLALCEMLSASSRIWTHLMMSISFSKTGCITKAEEPSLHYYSPIARGKIIGFVHLGKVWVLCEMQSALSRIWTQVAVSISYDNNHHTMGTFRNSFFKFLLVLT